MKKYLISLIDVMMIMEHCYNFIEELNNLIKGAHNLDEVANNIDFEAIQKCTEQYEQQLKQKLEEDGTSKTFK